MSTGFWVATTMKGRGTAWARPSTVTCCSSMTSSNADWVLGEARLISSASTTLLKIGPGRNVKVPSLRFHTVSPTTSDGSRSGVNCTRPKLASSDVAKDLARLVLPTPGTSSSSRWPSEIRQSRINSMTSRLPWITRSMLSTTRSK